MRPCEEPCDTWNGLDVGAAFWSGSDPALSAAVFDVVFDEDLVEPRPRDAPDAWRARADELRTNGRTDAHPPRPSR